jgi:hypothetical protein
MRSINSAQKKFMGSKKFFSLKNKIIARSSPRKIVGWSLLSLIKHHVKSIIICFFYFPISIYEGREFLKKTFDLRNSAIKKKALIIGNGPSQEYLNANELDMFTRLGGETYCVNYWNCNKKLSSHIPTWMVFSDTVPFSKKSNNSVNLIKYLRKNSSIKIIVSTFLLKSLKKLALKNKIYCFVDVELSVWKNINPLLPRGYLSMTLNKALAWANYLNYNSIGVIGMDNTYAKDLYIDEDNSICLLERHAGSKDYLIDISSEFSNAAAYIDEITRLFYHLEYFPQKKIFNLDPYSLTDRFKKVTKDSFFGKASVKK